MKGAEVDESFCREQLAESYVTVVTKNEEPRVGAASLAGKLRADNKLGNSSEKVHAPFLHYDIRLNQYRPARMHLA